MQFHKIENETSKNVWLHCENIYGTSGNIPPTVYFGINLDYVRDKVVEYKYAIYTANISIEKL